MHSCKWNKEKGENKMKKKIPTDILKAYHLNKREEIEPMLVILSKRRRNVKKREMFNKLKINKKKTKAREQKSSRLLQRIMSINK